MLVELSLVLVHLASTRASQMPSSLFFFFRKNVSVSAGFVLPFAPAESEPPCVGERPRCILLEGTARERGLVSGSRRRTEFILVWFRFWVLPFLCADFP